VARAVSGAFSYLLGNLLHIASWLGSCGSKRNTGIQSHIPGRVRVLNHAKERPEQGQWYGMPATLVRNDRGEDCPEGQLTGEKVSWGNR